MASFENSAGQRSRAVEVVSIEAVVVGGDGLARHVVEPAPERRQPPCRYYSACGGCQLQHLAYPAQLGVKAHLVSEALRRIGSLTTGPPEVTPSAVELGYRNRVTFILRRSGDDVVAGFRACDDPDRVVDVECCPLAEPAIQHVWTALRSAWGPTANRLPPGRELRLTLRATLTGDVGLAVAGGGGQGEPEALLAGIDRLRAVWLLDRRGAVAAAFGDGTLDERWGDHHLPLAGDAFLQVNRDAAAKLEAHVGELCADVAGRRVIDAYCGFGVRALELARRGARVVGIDRDRKAVAVAARAAAESGVAARFVAATAERALPRELPAHLVVLNPPRRGLGGKVVSALLERPPARLIYVSCDPATLARDLKALSGLFELSSCRAFDMFPQTAHVETVIALERGRPGGG